MCMYKSDRLGIIIRGCVLMSVSCLLLSYGSDRPCCVSAIRACLPCCYMELVIRSEACDYCTIDCFETLEKSLEHCRNVMDGYISLCCTQDFIKAFSLIKRQLLDIQSFVGQLLFYVNCSADSWKCILGSALTLMR